MKILPENYLRCMSEADRRLLGKIGRTKAETLAHAEAKNEKELQKQIVSLLRLKGIEVNVSRMDKRKTDRVGWPDLTFCIYAIAEQFLTSNHAWPKAWQTFPCAWEVKMPGREPTSEQIAILVKLRIAPNGWRCRVIHSVDEALKELREMGIE